MRGIAALLLLPALAIGALGCAQDVRTMLRSIANGEAATGD
jgi:hypothetical protein